MGSSANLMQPSRVIFKAREGDAFRAALDPAYPLELCERIDRLAIDVERRDLTLRPLNLFADDADDLGDHRKIERLMAQALELDPTYEFRDLRRYVAIDTNDPHFVRDLLLADRRTETELVYVEGLTAVAQDPAFNLQDRSATHVDYFGIDGVDVRGLWSAATQPNFAVNFADVEMNWDLNHSFLENKIDGDARANFEEDKALHGTSVLSIVLSALGKQFSPPSRVQQWGPNVGGHAVSNHGPIDAGIAQIQNERAITDAAAKLSPGDVLLLEVDKMPAGLPKLLPLETEKVTFDTIRAVTASQIIVVEPAGNAGLDLATVYQDANGNSTLLPTGQGNDANRPFVNPQRDSGAIIVGAADPARGATRVDSSNFGARVDCCAAGVGVVSTITHSGDDPAPFSTQGLGQTSGASAIVAGCLMLLQAFLAQKGKAMLTPTAVRNYLRDPTLATTTGTQIGNLPSFSQIARRCLH